MASLYMNETLPTTSEEAIRQFNEKYLAIASAAPAPSWANPFVLATDSPRTTFPLSAFATKFKETRDFDGTRKGMNEKSFDVKVAEYDGGYEAKLYDLFTNVFAYRNWGKAPAELKNAEQRHVAKKLAALLEAGTSTTSPWDAVNFFSASHLCNPFDSGSTTFSNYQSNGTAPETLANIQAEMISMMGVLDVNGDKLGVVPNEIWLPTAKYQMVSDKLNQAFLSSGESNYMAGKLRAVHVPELTDTNDWYLVDTNLISRGFDPMIAMNHTVPGTLGMRVFDESSDFYKNTGKIAISQHIWYGFALLFPHAIRKVVGA